MTLLHLQATTTGGVVMMALATTMLLTTLPRESTAFLTVPAFHSPVTNHIQQQCAVPYYLNSCRHPHRSSWSSPVSRLAMASAPDFGSTDPFRVLGLDPSPNLSKKDIKRVYKRLALRYHPDMVTTKDSTLEEKKRASDRFAEINRAYATLSGKNQNEASSQTSTASGSSRGSTSSGGWTPPHRRSGAYSSPSSSSSTSSSSGQTSTDWRDYMPNYQKDEEIYDTGGDSFGAIFSDLISGAAGAAAGTAGSGAGVLNDFIEFLENTVDGYKSSGSSGGSSRGDDAELQFLLQTGSLQDVGDEMDETDLVVQQLTSKVKSLQDELIMLQAELATTTRFTEKLKLQERMDELQARKKIAQGYVEKARKRLLALQTRYKQLIVGGDNDTRAGGRTTTRTWDTAAPRRDDVAPSPSDSSASSSSSSRHPGSREDDAWDDGFGSFGRGRGSSRRRSSQQSTSTNTGATSTGSSSTSSSSYSTRRDSAASSTYGTSRDSTSSSRQSPSSSSSGSEQAYVPPHRRTSTSFESRKQEDERRLREVKVEEEFDKLKRDLGL